MTMHFFRADGDARRTSSNVVVLRDDDGLVMFDVGSGLQEDVRALTAKMHAEGCDVRDVHTILLSHLHPDHAGALMRLRELAGRGGVRVFVPERERSIASTPSALYDSLDLGLIPKYLDSEAVRQAPGLRHATQALLRILPAASFPADFEIHDLRNGQVLEFGDFAFRVVATPGHSPGHTSFYEPHHKVLVSGDLLGEESSVWYTPSCGGVREFARSLDRVAALEVARIFPSHGDAFADLQQRIKVVRELMARRDALIIEALEEGPRTFWELAERMFDARLQRVFPGLMLVMTHLERLEAEGCVVRDGHMARRTASSARAVL